MRHCCLFLLLLTCSCATTTTSTTGRHQTVTTGSEETADAPTGDTEPVGPVKTVDPEPRWTRLSFVTPRGEPMTLHIPTGSASIGKPADGRLENPRSLGSEGPGFVHFGKALWGTDETVTLIMFATGELLRDYPRSVPALIGSLSLQTGGPLPPHKSHQSGRDVDIAFFARDNQPLRSFGELDPAEIDFEKSLTLLVNLISTGQVQFIFVNYALQKFFHEAAVRMGYSQSQLEYLFQYPSGKRSKKGVIRHSEGHFRHAHIRFVCPAGDDDCTN